MSKHTPGPWRIVSGFPPIVRGGEENGVPDLEIAVYGLNVKADANLIAAAPDLLEAAEAALAVLRFDTQDVWRDKFLAVMQAAKAREAYARLLAAIAKARGEAQT